MIVPNYLQVFLFLPIKPKTMKIVGDTGRRERKGKKRETRDGKWYQTPSTFDIEDLTMICVQCIVSVWQCYASKSCKLTCTDSSKHIYCKALDTLHSCLSDAYHSQSLSAALFAHLSPWFTSDDRKWIQLNCFITAVAVDSPRHFVTVVTQRLNIAQGLQS